MLLQGGKEVEKRERERGKTKEARPGATIVYGRQGLAQPGLVVAFLLTAVSMWQAAGCVSTFSIAVG